MTKKRDKKRRAPISYRPPASLREEFRARVEKSGLSTSAYLTLAWSSMESPRQIRRPPVEQKTLAKLLAEAGHIRQLLHEISLSGGCTPNNTLLIEKAEETLMEIRTALLKGMGRDT